MIFEDYFPFYKRKELSPLTIHVHDTEEGSYQVTIEDKKGVMLTDPERIPHADIDERLEALTRTLRKERKYDVGVKR